MKIAICDDEVASQERTVSYVEDYISEKKTDVEYEVFNSYVELENRIDEFNLFVLDYMMPEINGISFAKNYLRFASRVSIFFSGSMMLETDISWFRATTK